MILGFLKKLRAFLKPASGENERPNTLDPVETLRVICRELSRLAEQIHAHAERAPYPYVAQRLRQIAMEKRKSANILKEKLLSLREEMDETQFVLKSGKNHWERMVQDLQDQRALESSFLEQAVRLAAEAPEISDLLKGSAAAQLPHKETLLDLVARADPQADQS